MANAGVKERISSALDGAYTLAARVDHRVALSVLVVFLCAWFLYLPVRSLYVAKRQEEVLALELEQVNEANDEILASIEHLQTHEGIEDAAREMGYVEEGEVAAVVEGLEEDDALSGTNASEDDVFSWPWYIDLGDFVFGFDADLYHS